MTHLPDQTKPDGVFNPESVTFGISTTYDFSVGDYMFSDEFYGDITSFIFGTPSTSSFPSIYVL
jgi:hypothetical protein